MDEEEVLTEAPPEDGANGSSASEVLQSNPPADEEAPLATSSTIQEVSAEGQGDEDVPPQQEATPQAAAVGDPDEPPQDWLEPLDEDDFDEDEEVQSGSLEGSMSGGRGGGGRGNRGGYKRRSRNKNEEEWDDWPILGEGWKRREVMRRSGTQAGKSDTYYMGPRGERARSKVELAKYLSSTMDLDSFDFKSGTFHASPRKRQRAPKAAPEKDCMQSDQSQAEDQPVDVQTPQPGRRKRSKNFSDLEKKLLEKLVLSFPAAQGRSQGTFSETDRNAAWKAVQQKFNNNSMDTPRTILQLKYLWSKMRTVQGRRIAQRARLGKRHKKKAKHLKQMKIRIRLGPPPSPSMNVELQPLDDCPPSSPPGGNPAPPLVESSFSLQPGMGIKLERYDSYNYADQQQLADPHMQTSALGQDYDPSYYSQHISTITTTNTQANPLEHPLSNTTDLPQSNSPQHTHRPNPQFSSGCNLQQSMDTVPHSPPNRSQYDPRENPPCPPSNYPSSALPVFQELTGLDEAQPPYSSEAVMKSSLPSPSTSSTLPSRGVEVYSRRQLGGQNGSAGQECDFSLSNRLALKFHKQRMRFLRQEHKLRMQVLRLELSLRRQEQDLLLGRYSNLPNGNPHPTNLNGNGSSAASAKDTFHPASSTCDNLDSANLINGHLPSSSLTNCSSLSGCVTHDDSAAIVKSNSISLTNCNSHPSNLSNDSSSTANLSNVIPISSRSTNVVLSSGDLANDNQHTASSTNGKLPSPKLTNANAQHPSSVCETSHSTSSTSDTLCPRSSNTSNSHLLISANNRVLSAYSIHGSAQPIDNSLSTNSTSVNSQSASLTNGRLISTGLGNGNAPMTNSSSHSLINEDSHINNLSKDSLQSVSPFKDGLLSSSLHNDEGCASLVDDCSGSGHVSKSTRSFSKDSSTSVNSSKDDMQFAIVSNINTVSTKLSNDGLGSPHLSSDDIHATCFSMTNSLSLSSSKDGLHSLSASNDNSGCSSLTNSNSASPYLSSDSRYPFRLTSGYASLSKLTNDNLGSNSTPSQDSTQSQKSKRKSSSGSLTKKGRRLRRQSKQRSSSAGKGKQSRPFIQKTDQRSQSANIINQNRSPNPGGLCSTEQGRRSIVVNHSSGQISNSHRATKQITLPTLVANHSPGTATETVIVRKRGRPPKSKSKAHQTGEKVKIRKKMAY